MYNGSGPALAIHHPFSPVLPINERLYFPFSKLYQSRMPFEEVVYNALFVFSIIQKISHC